MPRTVVYPIPAHRRPRTKTPAIETVSSAKDAVPKADSLTEKLLKYIPAEVIAFYLSAYVLAGQWGEPARWAVLAAGFVGTATYLFASADKENPPHWYFYLLAMLSFLAWAIGTSSVGVDLFKWDPTKAEGMSQLIVAVAVFLIPLTDQLLTKLLPNAPTLPAPQPVAP
jgi:hypothetical protein